MAEMRKIEKFVVNSRIYNYLYCFFVLRKLKAQVGKYIINGRTLELGCGPGYTSVFIKDNFPVSELLSIDYDADEITETRKRGRQDIIFQQGDATNLKLKDNSFDNVIQLMAFHHISEWKKAIKEAYRVTKKGGCFVTEDLPNSLVNKLFHLWNLTEGLFSVEEYCKELEKCGFTIEKIKGKKLLIIAARK